MFPPSAQFVSRGSPCVLPGSLTTNTIQTREKGSTLEHCNSISRIICISWAIFEHHREFKWTCSGGEISDIVNRWKQTRWVCSLFMWFFSPLQKGDAAAKFTSQKISFILLQHILNSSLNFWLILFMLSSKLRWSDGWSCVLLRSRRLWRKCFRTV